MDVNDQRQELADQLQTGIEYASEKIESGRVVDEEKENVRLQYLNALDDLVATKNLILHHIEESQKG